jgi:hypothetical protein
MLEKEADVMKSTFFHIALICVMVFGLFSTMALISCHAESEGVQLSIVQKNAEKIKTIGTGTQTAVYYKITIVLHNAGNVTSEEITLGIQDEADGLWTNKTATIPAGESATFIFDNWPVLGIGEHNVSIGYRPTNDSITKTSSNSGTDSLVLAVTLQGEDQNATPGFELIAVLGVLIAFALFRKR